MTFISQSQLGGRVTGVCQHDWYRGDLRPCPAAIVPCFGHDVAVFGLRLGCFRMAAMLSPTLVHLDCIIETPVLGEFCVWEGEQTTRLLRARIFGPFLRW